jgi:prepilin peptidase CpaA
VSHLQLALAAVAAAVLIAGAVWDLKSLRIPNLLVLALILTALANGAAAGSLRSVGWVGALIALIAGVLLWKARLVGGGDVKFVAAAMLWLPGQASDFIVLTGALGLVTALIFLVRAKMVRKGLKIPYGPPVAAAAITLMALRMCSI